MSYRKEIQELIRIYEKRISNRSDKLLSKRESIDSLKKAFSSDKQLVLVLGAGVSIEFGVPGWDLLLQELMIGSLDMSNEQNLSNFTKHLNSIFQPSPILIGRYIANNLKKGGKKKFEFENRVRDTIYEKINKEKESLLFNQLMRYIFPEDNSSLLNSIITYNFDDILEYKIGKYSDDNGISDKKTVSIYGHDKVFGKGMIPIYHVHGFLPEKGKITEDNLIVLGETTYHNEYHDVYKWTNLVQLEKFKYFPCLFIGSSLTDPNTRRLLDIAHKQKPEKDSKFHFIIRRRQNPDEINLKKGNSLNKKELTSLAKFYDTILQDDALSLGVNTIWVNDYSDIPEILNNIII
ncbi:MAG: SIR2 family protein [Bacteroidia bacterium]|nr:SIR2 family protein [Bacteroidia bacterium]